MSAFIPMRASSDLPQPSNFALDGAFNSRLSSARAARATTGDLPNGKSETSLGELASRANESARCVEIQTLVGFSKKLQFLVPRPPSPLPHPHTFPHVGRIER